MNEINDLIYEQNKVVVDYKYGGDRIIESTVYLEPSPDIVTINIVIYFVTTTSKLPFLQFILYKNDESLNFVRFLHKPSSTSKLMKKCQEILHSVVKAFKEDREDSNAFEYKGYTEFQNDMFLFFQLEENIFDTHLLFDMNDLCVVLVDEILNQSKVDCLGLIDQNVIDFMSSNLDFAVLLDSEDKCYESPCVCYYGTTKKKTEFYSTFGVPPVATTGNHFIYVFKDFVSACEDAYSDSKLKHYGSLIRVAVFLGTTEVEDSTSTLNTSHKQNIESVITLLPDNRYVICTKEYEQQCPITYHFLKEGNQIV